MVTNYMIEDPLMWEKINKDIAGASGIYKLRCLSTSTAEDHYMQIQRVAGVDDGGILYIGAASGLSNRLATVKKSICAAFNVKYKDPRGHSTGRCFSKSDVLRKQFPLSGLCVTLEVVDQTADDPADHFALENDAIDSYAKQFGEAPPLNSMGRAGLE